MVANWFLDISTNEEIRPSYGGTVSMEFRHRELNVSLTDWETKCAVSDVVRFDNSWNILACNTERLNATSTRCYCSKTGTFAVILTNKSQKNQLTHQKVIVNWLELSYKQHCANFTYFKC
ncbi:hypothetical protein HHI36_009238 [Cryptolaemus montrouzieri]|uniref:GPS domain-containing protein n=1 Tax=Cryptolaemus montrouzieri TaxID=559131 RepID=A0ABD2MUX9_9CUCU